jgi:hypothetical protein
MMSRIWYLVAFLVFGAGVAAAGWLLWSGLSGLGTALARVIVPGATVISLDNPGSYTIFHEAESVIDGRLYASHNIAGLQVKVTSETTGSAIPVTTPSSHASYSLGGHSGVSVLAFDIAEPGRYRLSGSYRDGRAEPRAVLAIGHGFVGRLLGTIFAALGAGFGGFVAAVAIAIVTFVKRRRMVRA